MAIHITWLDVIMFLGAVIVPLAIPVIIAFFKTHPAPHTKKWLFFYNHTVAVGVFFVALLALAAFLSTFALLVTGCYNPFECTAFSTQTYDWIHTIKAVGSIYFYYFGLPALIPLWIAEMLTRANIKAALDSDHRDTFGSKKE